MRHGQAAGDDRLDRPVVERAAGVVVNKLAQGRVVRQLVDTGFFHLSAEAVKRKARAPLGAPLAIPCRAILDDVYDLGDGLDVVDHRRLAVQALDRWKRRLKPRMAAVALQRG